MQTLITFLLIAVSTTSAATNDESTSYVFIPGIEGGQTTIVNLFEWKWTDVANECEKFLQYYGYGAVEVSPPQEHLMYHNKSMNVPWWVIYQPVSYELKSRLGNEAEFKDMVKRCNAVNVRVIVDVVLNHMTLANLTSTTPDISSSGGSPFSSVPFHESYVIPYCTTDTHDAQCNEDVTENDIKSDAKKVRICRFEGLIDLNQSNDCVQYMMIQYLKKLVGFGVAGFVFDKAEYMEPHDIGAILQGVGYLNEKIFGAEQKPFAVQDVYDIDGNNAIKANEYYSLGRYTDFDYGQLIKQIFAGEHYYDQRAVTIADLVYWPYGYGQERSIENNVLAFIDDHESQRYLANDVYTFKNRSQLLMTVAYMLADDFALPRVMSSYYFTDNNQGPPSTPEGEIKSPEFNSDGTCKQSSGYVCEHREIPIRNMAKFRKVVGSAKLTYIDVDKYSHYIALSRDGKGFIIVNNDDKPLEKYMNVNVPAGAYCDLFDGELVNGTLCTGTLIYVNNENKSGFTVPAKSFTAIHIDERIKECSPM